MTIPRTSTVLILLLGSLSGFADNLTYLRIERPVIEKRVQTAPASEAERLRTLRDQFRAAGCSADLMQEQIVPGEALPNLVCLLPGPDPGAILIASRIDYTGHGDEDLVDWGSVAMLPLLAESLNSAPHRQTIILAAFTGHDHGFAGANWYLNQLSDDQRRQIRGVIDLDKVGRTPAAYAFPGPDTSRMASVGSRAVLKETAHGPTTLSKVLPIAAHTLKFPAEPREINDVPATDARVFEEAGIPAIVIHSVAYAMITPPGKLEQVRLMRTSLDPQTYNDTYNLLCVYALYLDKAYTLARAKQQTQQAQTTTGVGQSVSTETPSVTTSSNAPEGVRATPVASDTPSPVNASTSALPVAPKPEEPPLEASGNPVFRATTRLVQVDVVATDKQGHPISGLQQSDFTVLQDGKPQNVRVFEAHVGTSNHPVGVDATAASKPVLPANTYSNLPHAATFDSWTIVLLDLLNTPPTDQDYARKQLLQLLNSAPKGQPLSLYLLTNRLTMVQGFTDDPQKLLKAAESLTPGRSHVLTTEAERQHTEGEIAYTTSELTASAPATSENPMQQAITEGRMQQIRNMESFQLADRAMFTLSAFEGLSRAVSGYPGRKNLIWLSGSFPVRIDADPKMQTDPWRNSVTFVSAMASTSALLSRSRIAVYPVDVRGLQSRGVDISTSSSEAGTYTSSQNSGNYGALRATQAANYNDERTTMTDVAHQTGGEAFVGTNDLKRAMQRSMEDGATYYTLAYTPDKVDPQTVFHRIEVKSGHPDAHLSYRRGYYSSPQKAAPVEKGAAALRGALQPGMPQSTMLFFTASVTPPDATHKTVRIQYVVNPNSVTFTDVADQRKRIVLDCMAVAYDEDGREVGHASNTLDGTIKAAAYETVMNKGVPAQQDIDLPPGVYNLRLGVMDRDTQQIGTVDVPLLVPGQVAANK